MVCLLAGPAALAQSPEGPPPTQNIGEAEVALQGYYLGGSGQPLSDTSGTAISFRQFIGGIGLLSGSFQAYGSQGDFHTGDNFLDLNNLSLLGQRWHLTGGDFHVSPNVVENPFNNIYNPEVVARGFRLEVSRENRRFGFFVGGETLQEGPRVSFRVDVPQSVIGAFVQQRVGDHLQMAVRYLHFGSSENDIETQPLYFPQDRQFRSADSLALQSSYSFGQQFKLYGEVATSRAEQGLDMGQARGGTVSMFFGPVSLVHAVHGVVQLPIPSRTDPSEFFELF